MIDSVIKNFVHLSASFDSPINIKDTESKISQEFEDVHLKEIMNQLGAKSARLKYLIKISLWMKF